MDVWDNMEHAVLALADALRVDRIVLPHINGIKEQKSLRRGLSIRLATLEADERRLLDLEAQLRTVRNSVRHNRACVQMSLTPVGLLPTEILCSIFESLDSWRDIRTGSQVCRHWRYCCLAHSSLWLHPDWDTFSPDALEEWIARSGSNPIDIALRCKRRSLRDLDVSDPFMWVLKDNMPRTRSFSFDFDPQSYSVTPDSTLDTARIAVESLLYTKHKNSSLQALSLICRSSQHLLRLKTTDSALRLPALRSLHLQGVSIHNLHHITPQLEHLCLHVAPYPTRHVIVALQMCPNLKSLALVGRPVLLPSIDVPMIYLPRLESLTLEEMDTALSCIFISRVHVPNLRELTVTSTEGPNNTFQVLTQMGHRLDNLESLRINGRYQDLVTTLEEITSFSHGSSFLPELQSLTITLGKTNVWASELEPGGFELALKNFIKARALAQVPTLNAVVLDDDDDEMLSGDEDYDDYSHRRQQPQQQQHQHHHHSPQSRSYQQAYSRQRRRPPQQRHHAREPVVLDRLLVFQCSSEFAVWLRKRVHVLEIQDLAVFYPRAINTSVHYAHMS